MAVLFGIVGAVAGWIFIGIFRAGDRLFLNIPRPIYFRRTLAFASLIGFFLAPKAPLIKSQPSRGDEEAKKLAV